MSKSPDAFRTISEVADWLGVQAHVLRFWESRFNQVKPVKRAGGRRYYRPNDMRLLGGIKKLLHEDGITIKGVQRILREQGVAHVASLSQGLDEMAEPPEVAEGRHGCALHCETRRRTTQIGMDLGDEPQQRPDEPGRCGRCAPAAAGTPMRPHRGTGAVDAAPLLGGVASLAWNRTEFDADLLREIAPIAKELRDWMNRVEPRAAG